MHAGPQDPSPSGAPTNVAIVGYGFVGARVARTAVARGIEVRAIARHERPGVTGVEFVAGDVSEAHVADELLDGIDHVVYAAGTAKPAESNVDPLYDAERNLRPLLMTLQACARRGVRRFSFLSSGGTVYGPDAPVPAREDSPTWPISSYGVLKVAAERYVGMYGQLNDMSVDILRCANVYGPGEPTTGSQGIIGITRALLLAGRPVTVYGDGSARRDFVHADDVAQALFDLVPTQSGVRLFNVGSGVDISVAEIINLVARQLGVEPTIDRRPPRAADVPVVRLCIDAIQRVIEFEPRSVEQALASNEVVA